ncbi:uncharacterized protein [Dermacentor albipictus]|uniref:uncharacterized protein n=1 Tax=Dermacentor albipictus TaxID=60249 RepID=UPI0038FC044F
MAPVVLRYGFRKVAGIDEYFRASALEKGRKLCAAKYAYDVEETLERFDGDSQVVAKCHSQVRQATYDVNIQLSSQRRILGAQCTCKAGLGGGCKHVAAVVLFVNEADAPSSTDRPQGWGRPSSKPDTSRRESIEELFGEYKPLYVGGKCPKEEPPSYVLHHFPDINCLAQRKVGKDIKLHRTPHPD